MHLGTNFCSRQLPRQKLVAENLGEKAEVDKVFWIWNQYDKEKINMTSIEQPEDQYDKQKINMTSIWQPEDQYNNKTPKISINSSAALTSTLARILWLRWNIVTPCSTPLSFLFSRANVSKLSSHASSIPLHKSPGRMREGWRGCGRLMEATATNLRQKPGALMNFHLMVSNCLESKWCSQSRFFWFVLFAFGSNRDKLYFAISSTSITVKLQKTRCTEYNTWFTECLEGNSTEVATRTRFWPQYCWRRLPQCNIWIKRNCCVVFYQQ